ncbi:Uncharacterized protein TCM_036348 [Theobroma cacao]|uniref:Uncharacterized protein n=1 Tax=Theobroma cacao TaxID=3641 RepID=A0A061FRS8_THECC|nr:Uncharacterized protein TCM_036348 [Theobroma cacao]
MRAQGDAGRHQERMFATEHARLAARDATAFHLVPMATSMPVPAMQSSKPMGISPSAPDFKPTIRYIWIIRISTICCNKGKYSHQFYTLNYYHLVLIWDCLIRIIISMIKFHYCFYFISFYFKLLFMQKGAKSLLKVSIKAATRSAKTAETTITETAI